VLRVVGFLVSAFSFCSYVSGYMQQTELGTISSLVQVSHWH